MALNLDELLIRIFENSFVHPIQTEQTPNCPIRLALERVYSNSQAWIVTDLFNDRSPFQKDNEEGSLVYVKEIERIIDEDQNLTKPIVSAYKNEKDGSWDLMIILPKNSTSNTPKIYYRNSRTTSEIPLLIKFLLLNELSATEEDSQNIKGGVLKDAEFIAQPDFIKMSSPQQNEGGWWALLNAMLIIREENENKLNNIKSWASVSLEINNFLQENGIDLSSNIEQLPKTIDTKWTDIQKSLLRLTLNDKISTWEIRNKAPLTSDNEIEDRLRFWNNFLNTSSYGLNSSRTEEIKNDPISTFITPRKNFSYNNVLRSNQNSNIKIKKDLELIVNMPIYDLIINDNSVIVDKTLFIKEIFDCRNLAILITRPRRWGKTKIMEMLRAFLHPKRNNDGDLVNKTLFSAEREMLINESCTDSNSKKFAIATAKDGYYINNLAGKIPVIFITFSRIVFNQSEALEAAIHKTFWRTIANSFNDHWDVCNAKKKHQKSEYQYEVQNDINTFEKYLHYDPNLDLEDSIPFLSNFLKKYYGERVCVIIDQYDAPFNKLLRGDKFEAVVNKMNILLNCWIKENLKNLKKVIMTGILGNGSDYMFYDMNDVYLDNVLSSRFSKYFGFTKREVELLLRQCLVFGTEEELKQYKKDIKSWYDGYNIGGIKVYNPFSIMSCLTSTKLGATPILRPYWIELEKNLELERLFKKFADTEKFTELQRTGYLKLNKSLESNVSFSTFFSFLLHSGYLTSLSTKVKESSRGKSYTYLYAVPNKEVKNYVFDILFPKILEELRKNLPALDLNGLVGRLNASLENVQEYREIIKREVLNNWDNIDHKEIDFQVIPAGAWFFAKIAKQTQRHILWNEQVNDYGYIADALYIPIKDKSTKVVVHEYKKIFGASTKSADRKALDAIIQIYEKFYMDSALKMYLKDRHDKYFTHIIVRGIVFYFVNIDQKWDLKIIQYEHTMEEAIKISEHFKLEKKELLNCKTEEDLEELLNQIKSNQKRIINVEEQKIGADLEALDIYEDKSLKRKNREGAESNKIRKFM